MTDVTNIADVADVAIRATDLKKVYRLYAKPAYRFLDMFGLLGDKAGAFTEHAALDGISLEIRRGEKVAIIGRNGAGKSTFLKLVTKVIRPSAGSLEVKGDVHALLQIGTGFHPDFTGRQNVYAYLAQLGVTGEEADRRCADAIAFAELEEYIDQPVKTYSTGMAMRLMFSTSTAIVPDLLVLDEVLGVGDAYFAQKSYDRMRELCDRNGATLLLVTHDIYSAVKMCSRVLWFDRGAVAMDGDGTSVVKAYEESIRMQEERRLRLKKQAELKTVRRGDPSASHTGHLLLEIRALDGLPQASPVYFGGISLMNRGEVVAQLPLGDAAFDDAGGSHLVREGGCWGDTTEWRGRAARPMLNYGSPFHKVVGVLAVPHHRFSQLTDASFVLDYWSDEACELRLRCYAGEHAEDLGELSTVTGRWACHAAAYSANGAGESGAALLPSRAAGIQGAGEIIVTRFSMLNGTGAEIFTLRHGEAVTFRIDFRILKKNLRERAQVFIVISRNNTERVCKFMTDQLLFDEAEVPDGVVEMHLPKMMLGAGQYSVAVQIAAQGFVEAGITKFFSVDPDVYYCITHALEFTVTNSGWIGDGTLFEGEGAWRIRGTGE
jgi:ABC-type polysaccharide/polyol phosphate transport system ATPase subunit